MTKRLALSAGLLAAVCVSSLAHAADSDSQTFIKNAIQGNFAEISLGQLAQQKGTSDGVKQFGQMLVSDHSQANQKAVQAANAISVTPPTEPNADQKAMHDKLAGESGADFDRDFASEMVNDHQKDIADYQAEAKMSPGDAVSQYATETLPTLQKHLSTAQSLASNTTGAMAPAATTAPAATAPVAPSTTMAPKTNTSSETPPLPGANSFTEAQAISRIESAGFTAVTGMKKDDQGIWRGQASKNGASVAVSLDYKGNVSSH